MNRREFLKFSGGGIAAVAVGSAGGWSLFGSNVARADHRVDLTMIDVDAEMVDGVAVPMWAYTSSLLGPRIPGPVIFVTEGDEVRLTIANDLGKGGEHGFDIPGVEGAATGPIPKGEARTVQFTAPAAGTYMYLDPLNAPVNRVMGLHGALVVLPPKVGFNTPYSTPTPNVQKLFDHLGTDHDFPGHPWDRNRNAIWVVSTVDPAKNAAADSSSPISPAAFQDGYLPQYFTLNGKSGFFAAQHGAHSEHEGLNPDPQNGISIHGRVGEPCIIRSLNAGLMWQSLHIHGNHVYTLFERDRLHRGDDERVIREQLHLVDTWSMPPESIKDVLLPFIRPPDIPLAAWPPVQEKFPLLFPMHDHQEVSNTAAGGNYPQGCATHFQFDGDISPRGEVILVDRAELRVRTGELIVQGRISTSRISQTIDIHAGATESGPRVGTATVTAGPPGGLDVFTFRGRALKALGERRITLHAHSAQSHALAEDVPLTLR